MLQATAPVKQGRVLDVLHLQLSCRRYILILMQWLRQRIEVGTMRLAMLRRTLSRFIEDILNSLHIIQKVHVPAGPNRVRAQDARKCVDYLSSPGTTLWRQECIFVAPCTASNYRIVHRIYTSNIDQIIFMESMWLNNDCKLL